MTPLELLQRLSKCPDDDRLSDYVGTSDRDMLCLALATLAAVDEWNEPSGNRDEEQMLRSAHRAIYGRAHRILADMQTPGKERT